MAYNHGREDRKWRVWKEAEEKALRECGVEYVPGSGISKYCPACAKRIQREKSNESKRRSREQKRMVCIELSAKNDRLMSALMAAKCSSTFFSGSSFFCSSMSSMESESCQSSVASVICNLRKKIEPDNKNPTYIKTVLGIGWGNDGKRAFLIRFARSPLFSLFFKNLLTAFLKTSILQM